MEHTKKDCNCWDVIISMEHGLQCSNCGAVEKTNDSYTWGYRAGRADRALNQPAKQVALHSPNEQYANGYRIGYFENNQRIKS